MSILRPSLAFALSTTRKGSATLAAHLRKSAPNILQEMSALVAPVSAMNAIDLRERYEELAMRFAVCPSADSSGFDALVNEALKDAGKCGVEPTAMDLLPDCRIPLESMPPFLERRIGLRFLLSHYATLRDKGPHGDLGIFERECKLAVLCRSAVLKIQLLCMRKYNRAPKIRVEETGMSHAVMTTVPQPIQYIICELLKNSAKASIEAAQNGAIPPIEVRVEKSGGKANFSVVDAGGGLSKNVKPFEFRKIKRDAGELDGFGVGLPISRMYARYFEGDLSIFRNTDGTTAHLWLPEYTDIAANKDLMSSPCFLRNAEDMPRSLRQVRF